MRPLALALLLVSAPVLAQPKDAPVRCLAAGDEAKLNAVFEAQHTAIAGLKAENAELRKRTQAIADDKSKLPVVVAVLVGVVVGASATAWVVTR